ncbi:fibrillin-2-like [Ptychodera flava]|uniref:fibrillin-2-like n=1 Tax=Ptychodera flava TaxID=63121 RepID=UPI00396A6F20
MRHLQKIFIFLLIYTTWTVYLVQGSSCSASCTAGEYYESSTNMCVDCLAGYYCVGGNTAMAPCPGGTYNDQPSQDEEDDCQDCSTGSYSSAGSESCTLCPGGFMCPIAGLSSPTECGQGYFANNGSAACTACPAGYKCPYNGMLEPVVCEDGYYTNAEAQISCTECPAGSECPNGASETTCPAGYYSAAGVMGCSRCAAGTYSSSGAEQCTICGQGYACPDPSSSPVQCTKGYVSLAGSTNCTRCANTEISEEPARTTCLPCPAGKACSDPTQDPVDCASGEYALLGNGTCTTCPAGYKCPTTSSIEDCSSVPDTYSVGGATDCTSCPAGYECTTTSLTQCATGQYSADGDTTCADCGVGNYCPSFSSGPTACPSGYYADTATATSCTPCSPGYECTTSTSAACTSRYYSLGLATSCTPCPAGYQCTSTTTLPVKCNTGYYNDDPLNQNCQQCEAGSACPDPTVSPTECTAGQYSDAGSTSCTDCPAGFACPVGSTGSTMVACGPGTYATGGALTCTYCDPGYYCPSTTTDTVIACEPGTYSDVNATSCTPCPAGKACPNADGLDIRDCEAGEYSTSRSTECTSCPAGYACPYTDSNYQDQCQPGTYSVGQQTSCSGCPPGYMCPYTNRDDQIECVDGYYSTGNQSRCLACSAGYECPRKDSDEAIECSPGSYSFGRQTECTDCLPGYYCPSTTQGPKPCETGYYSGLASPNCTLCEAGYECSDKEVPVECAPGKWSAPGSVKCDPCNPGYICPEASTSPSPAEGLCEWGGWCDGVAYYPCPPGTYNPKNGSRNQAEACTECPAGFYCLGPGEYQYEDKPCPARHYCPKGTSYATRFPCPGGTYNPNMNSTSQSACIVCPAGHYCPSGSDYEGELCPAGFYCTAGQETGFQNACPVGTYSNERNLTMPEQCTDCPVGHYCPYGSAVEPRLSPLPCNPGTYNPDPRTGHSYNCRLCDSGRSCPWSGQSNSTHPCAEGYYCPNGTITNDQYPCPPGTYTGETDLTSADECSACPLGYYCTWATGNTTNPPRPCKPGYYCPPMTPSPDRYPCPPGTFSPNADNSEVGNCTTCTEGYYCLGGQPSVSGICPPAYYCPAGTEVAEQYGCPNGTYNPHTGLSAASQCKNCTLGHFCEYASVSPIDCPTGTYMPYGEDSNGVVIGEPAGYQFDCLPCPGGSYCGNATYDPVECGTGFYSKDGQYDCVTCQIGHYCDNTTTSETDMLTNKRCPAGKYCLAGLHSVNDATDCTKAHYCPEATVEELNCPVGTYNPSLGLGAVTECLPCDAGAYCLEERETVNGYCSAGYYCPTNITNPYGSNPPLIGSYGPEQIPCPEATYRDSPGAGVLEDCLICTPGHYCEVGTSDPVICPRAFYCPEGSSAPMPCPIGRYGNQTGAASIEDCPLCDPGYYCDSQGLFKPRAPCDPGYLCYNGAYTSTPTDGVTGEICPAGGYCTLGSYESQPCPPGTYSNTSGAVNHYDCYACDPGFYCSNARTPEPTGPCNPGYFCTGGARTPNQTLTQPGHYSPSGSAMPFPCELGTYMPYDRAGECLTCEPGFYCPEKGLTNMTACPAGWYCGGGSFTPQACPVGTFQPFEYMISSDNCTDCPPGYYCNDNAITAPTGQCDAGHICYLNAEFSNPVYNDDPSGGQIILTWGDICGLGHYCPVGATYMVPCPTGTYLNYLGGKNESECIDCDPGYFCNETGIDAPIGQCWPGFYCLGGAAQPNPHDNTTGAPCSVRRYCPEGSYDERVCAVGTFANATGMSACLNCPEGFYCQPDNDPIHCPQGFYCIGSTNAAERETVPKACPVGTYGSREGLTDIAECSDCLPGEYCETEGLLNGTGLIKAGYWSKRGAQQAGPFGDVSDDWGICPPGFYCPEGSGDPTPCPPGTFSTSTHLEAELDCTLCTAGYYCMDYNLTAVTAECAPGYFCLRGSPDFQPTDPSYGGECPMGYKCPAGSEYPTPCLPGTYTNLTGQVTCMNCPAGFYCFENTTIPEPCPAGHYCGEQTQTPHQDPCPRGTFNNLTERSSVSDCLACASGYYCGNQGLDWPTDVCDPGWFCKNGSEFAQPVDPEQGGQCMAGEYCPAGSSLPLDCTPGMYCGSNQLSEPTDNCSAGYYCISTAVVANPTDGVTGDICPSGHYCPSGSPAGVACPPGTYSNTTGNMDINDCFNCTAGFYCEGYGNNFVTDECDEGYYCPEGQAVSNPNDYMCPQGHYCPKGSTEPVRCDSGTYQDEITQATCKTCPQGYFCDNTMEPVVLWQNSTCPNGHYCPEGTRYAYEFKCPRGTFSDRPGLNESDDCNPCPGGYFCPEEAMTSYSDLCSPGYFCRRYAVEATPDQDDNANICPAGFYCGEGTDEPSRCPKGTFSYNTMLERESDCLNCTKGYYCGDFNLTDPSGQCYEGYYCPEGSERPDQIDCPMGHYCTNGTFDPTPCPAGTFSNETNKIGPSGENGCYQCTGGMYCETEGLVEPTGYCGEGYYCPPGTVDREPSTTYCPIGHYCPEGVAYPIPCRNNSEVNHTHAVMCYECPAGYYCPQAGIKQICPRGYYCPQGTGIDLKSCPRGTYSSAEGNYMLSQCVPCEAGYYCDENILQTLKLNVMRDITVLRNGPSKPDGDNSSALQTNESCPYFDDQQTGYGGMCPEGHYCPQGSVFPTPCQAGTYAQHDRMGSCLPCEAGYYCPNGTITYSDKPCPSGHYCPEGTEFEDQYPCPAGTFNNVTGKSNISDCVACLGGQYCASSGLSSPTGPCEGGYYCDDSSTTSMPSGTGGDECKAGHFCPEGSPLPIACTGGYYCAVDRLSNVSGECDPGCYYCFSKAVVPNPNDGNATGDICPEGSYCPAVSDSQTLCTAGTFLNSTGNDEVGDCISCIGGGTALAVVMLCPLRTVMLVTTALVAGSGYPPEYNCTLGHYCPEGSPEPVRCPSGEYQDEIGQWECKDCPEGYFCDNTMEPVVLYNNSWCPTGFYCPLKTKYAIEFPCERGTFNNLTHRTELDDCQPCSGGMYCETEGLSEPTRPCQPGYYCTIGSNSSTPDFGSDNNECPVGHYCAEGTATPQPCPPGTFNPDMRLTAENECRNCTPGYYCGHHGMNYTDTQCDAGYYCDTGADIAQFKQCTPGHYCPVGTDLPIDCPAGYWSNTPGLTAESECTGCTGGYYCPTTGMTAVTEQCWGGYYCPGNVSVPNPVEFICPIGMVCPNGSEIYKSCEPGRFTNYTGASECEICTEGYYCLPVEVHNASLAYQPCPPGYYCQTGTGLDWQSCPAGTFSNVEGLSEQSQCQACDGGMYCDSVHLTEPTGNCSAGFYCTSGVDRPNPSANNATVVDASCACPEQSFFRGVGGICPLGHYCPVGSANPVPCEDSTYSDVVGRSLCETCPAGYYCMANATEFASYPCQPGYYCPNGTRYSTEYPCPPGTFNGLFNGRTLDDCQDCPLGKYCQGYGNSNYTDDCMAGWYCSGGSDSSNTTTHGGICQPGFYCPEGSGAPIPCTGGQYCQTEGLAEPTDDCAAGFYCTLMSDTPTPSDGVMGDECPAGFYCQRGSPYPTPCEPGTYSASKKNTNVTDCIQCSLGEYCGDYNMTETSGNCSQGFYCPRGQNVDDPYECPVGHYCPEHAFEPILCPSGTYQDQAGQWTCKTCLAGYYCDNSQGVVVINDTITCPAGHYCLPGTERADQYPCPRGTYGNDTGYDQVVDCTPCSGGQYCEEVGLTYPTGLCAAGFYCRQYANVSTPNLGYDADICPQGSYCPEGTAEPYDCPPGTFGATEGLHNSSSCTPCLAGYYCESHGLLAAEGPCSPGYYCLEGSDSRTKVICTTGDYCPVQSDLPTPCPEGTFNPYLGLNSSDQCTPCTEGMYCEERGLDAPTGPCEPGYYCPPGQNSSRPYDYPCTIGNYCPLNSSEPTPCAYGTFMNHTHASECYTCIEGWYCVDGDLVRPCPEGHYCPAGTGMDWQSCPRGTYSNETGLYMESQCKACDGGYYCDELNAVAVTDKCDPGKEID